MTSSDKSHAHAGQHRPDQADHPHHHATHAGYLRRGGRRIRRGLGRGLGRVWRRRFVRRTVYSLGAVIGVCVIAVLGLWWRLNNGPIEIDMATPWLTAAIEDNFGSHHAVAIGGTQIERDEKGRTSVRIRDIVVRDADGTVIASAPKAEFPVRVCSAGTFAPRASIWSAPKWPCVSRKTARSPSSRAPTNGRSRP